jgi:hypothetical protein
MRTNNRWVIAIAGVFLQVALDSQHSCHESVMKPEFGLTIHMAARTGVEPNLAIS